MGDAGTWSARLLILGLESSTVQVGAAVGGHEGVLAQAHSARGKRHAENLTPTIDFVTRSSEIDDHDRFVPDVVFEVTEPICGRT